jgi:hypothetical protein
MISELFFGAGEVRWRGCAASDEAAAAVPRPVLPSLVG